MGIYYRTLFATLLCCALSVEAGDEQSTFKRANQLIQSGDYLQAQRLLETLAEQGSRSPEVYNNLASLYSKAGDLDAARKILLKGLQTSEVYQTLYDNLVKVNTDISRQSYAKALVDIKSENQPLQTLAQLSSERNVSERAKTVLAAAEIPAVAAAPTQAAPSTTELIPSVMDPETEIRSLLNQWSQSWSARDPQAYVQNYASDYRPDAATSHQRWVKDRQRKLRRPKWIKVKLEQVEVNILDQERAMVRLDQYYESDRFSDITVKELHLHRDTQGNWKIIEEKVLSVR